MKNPPFLTASDIVERHHLSYQTLNYYTNLGLLHVAKRDGHQRLYDGRDVRRSLEAVTRLKDEGYPLRLICRMLANGLSSLATGLPTAAPPLTGSAIGVTGGVPPKAAMGHWATHK